MVGIAEACPPADTGSGPDGDKWSKTTQESLGGSGVSVANGVLLNPYHQPGAILINTKEADLRSASFCFCKFKLLCLAV